ncbi:hypothetical protein [Alkalibacillus salilacus]|uniref:Uncharacterized protein n=1 Tax=Alkalibacillus salilacus TaxID=284582 RepID=A0ABT9VDE7_9BACI|nr:hypothetical protein [Alkalibacillus salilacus]MDQ0158850.1 hypothetical protein [Alkalibacillus salilacus]
MDHDVDHAIFFNKVKKARDSLNGLTKEERKLAISFLQQTLDLEEDSAETTTVSLQLNGKTLANSLVDHINKDRELSDRFAIKKGGDFNE